MNALNNDAQYRKKRVAIMKKAIIAIMIILIVVPIVLCVILFLRMGKLEKKLNEFIYNTQISETQEALMMGNEMEVTSGDTSDGALNNENVDNHMYIEREALEDDWYADVKRVYLTFDDGPSENTNAILDILDSYNVKATFFVVAKSDETSLACYKRIVNDGHTLALHSTSHKYKEVYASMDSFVYDVSHLQEFLYEVTGYKPVFYRFPGGSSNTVSTVPISSCIDYLEDSDIEYFDWNVASGDANGNNIPVNTIYNNVISGVEQHDSSVVLLHDSNNKNTTVEALPLILQQLTDMGAKTLPITDRTTPVHHKIN